MKYATDTNVSVSGKACDEVTTDRLPPPGGNRSDENPTLAVWHNDCDWVVATSPEDATLVLAEHHGQKPEDYDEFSTAWEPWGEARALTMKFVDEPGDEKITLTGAEWAARGRAYLGSTEY